MDRIVLLESLKKRNIRVVAISKTKSADEIMDLYQTGHRDFGENKVQEMVAKQEILPADIRWHMVGHLQKNKVKFIAPFVDMIHSVDSAPLLEMIDRYAAQHHRNIQVLLQIRIASEDTKYGLEQEEATEIVESFLAGAYPHIQICGLMGMASFTDDEEQINIEFASLHDYFIELKEVYFHRAYYFRELSMGMSGDYEIAIDHGASIVRIGTLLFGER